MSFIKANITSWAVTGFIFIFSLNNLTTYPSLIISDGNHKDLEMIKGNYESPISGRKVIYEDIFVFYSCHRDAFNLKVVQSSISWWPVSGVERVSFPDLKSGAKRHFWSISLP